MVPIKKKILLPDVRWAVMSVGWWVRGCVGACVRGWVTEDIVSEPRILKVLQHCCQWWPNPELVLLI